MGPSGPMSKGGWRGWRGGNNYDHADCFEHVQGASFLFFDGKSGYFGDRTMEMYHIIRGFKKYLGSLHLKIGKCLFFPLIFIQSFPFCTILTLF